MLATLTTALTIDGYGPIADNAGGIVEMTDAGQVARERTDALDAAGNTTAAVGKGFAIGSACLVGLALVGAMLPYFFSALTMQAVGDAANQMMDYIKEDY